jgi:PAS domain S-box-containing protein
LGELGELRLVNYGSKIPAILKPPGFTFVSYLKRLDREAIGLTRLKMQINSLLIAPCPMLPPWKSLKRTVTQQIQRLPLQVVLVVPFVLQTAVAVGLTGWLSMRNGERAVNDVAYQLRNEVTERIRDRLHTYLETPRQINQINAKAIELGALDIENSRQLEEHLWIQINGFDSSITAIYLGQANGEFSGIGRQGADGVVLEYGIAGAETGNRFFSYSLDKASGERLENPIIGDPYDPRVRPWYQAAIAADGPVWSEIYADFLEARLKITASQPAYDLQGNILGVVGVDLVLAQISTFLETLKIGQFGQSFILDQSGGLIAASKPENLYVGTEENLQQLSVLDSDTVQVRKAARYLLNHFGSFQAIHGSHHLEFSLDGERQFVQVTPLNRFGLDWLIVVVVPEAEFMQQIHANTRTTILLCMGTLVVAIAFGILTSRWIVRPILQMSQSAQKLAQGDWEQTFPVDRRDELGVLARAFNQMAGQLRLSFATLEQRNQELEARVMARTADLQSVNQELSHKVGALQKTEMALVKALRNLRDSEERYRRIVENASDLITTTSLDDDFLYVSPNVTQILGYTPEQLVGTSWNTLIHPTDLETLDQVFMELIQSHDCRTSPTYRIRHQNGEWRWHSSTVAAVSDESGNILYYVGISRDVSDRIEAEETLRQAKEAAEIANQAKSEFLANMSHELRTPLNGILGYVQVLFRQEQLTPHQNHALRVIQQSGEHLLTLINDILDLSKIEARKMELHLSEFHLPNLLNSLSHLFQMRAEQKGITFRFEAMSPLPTYVRGDEQRLRQVLINLLGNAVKFTNQGSVVLRVGRLQEQQTHHPKARQTENRLRFAVIDTGCGIESDRLEAIFLPFQQANNHLQHSGGTGLGLSISLRLTEMMGSRLQVESRPGQGSTFWFDLYLEEVETPPVMGLEGDRQILRLNGSPRRILVVDDHPENRHFLVHVLESLGFEVQEASSGEDCLTLAQTFQPDAILVDLFMPKMDGFETTKRLRQSPNSQDLVIIATSASAFEQDRQRSFAAGCTDFLPKPIQIRELLAQLQHHLNLEWLYADAVTANPAHPPTTAAPDQLLAPPADLLVPLETLTRIGDIQGILHQASLLEAQSDRWKPFADEIRHLATSFQIKKLQSFVEKCRQPE